MTERCNIATATPPKCGATEGEGHRHISRDEAMGRAWLTWRSCGCEHGLKPHHVEGDGSIRENDDRDCQAATQKKAPKAISARQYEGRC